MLYNLISDVANYRQFGFNREQIVRIFGEISNETLNKRIDMSCIPQSYKDIVNEPLLLTFSPLKKADEKLKIPDLSVLEGRLFLSEKAYAVLESLIKNDGEFLPVIHENGSGYFFTPLQVAEPNKEVTFKNEWDEILSIGFIESDVKEYAVFRTDYDFYFHLYCQENIKQAIEKSRLTGLYITTDLATVFSQDRSEVESP
ncbi:hypothetical protein [Aliikangiella sp. IMCC44359]|uniref:hypothetical protein n=1 Tax=Aliikangiella sp. IMCC44359 TaxID=3459125 RepID=UPI00403A8007